MGEYNCTDDLQNLGNLKCFSLEGKPRKLILCMRTLENGDVNEFANVAAFTKTAIQAKFDNVNDGDRYYPTKEVASFEPTDADDIAPTDDYGEMFLLTIGTKSYKFKGWGWTGKYIQKIASFNNNSNLAAFMIFDSGNIGYLTDAATELKVLPIPIKGFIAKPITEDGMQKCSISFALDLEGPEVYLRRVLDANELDFAPLGTDVYALDDVVLSVTNPTIAGFTVTAKIMGRDDLPMRGLLVADLALTDDAAGPETITTLTATAVPGVYTAAATLGVDGYILTGSKKKYSFNTITFNVV